MLSPPPRTGFSRTGGRPSRHRQCPTLRSRPKSLPTPTRSCPGFRTKEMLPYWDYNISQNSAHQTHTVRRQELPHHVQRLVKKVRHRQVSNDGRQENEGWEKG